jgi:MFS family permease
VVYFELNDNVSVNNINITGLFPYVGFMVIYLGKASNENEAGYYSGFIASSAMAGRLFSSLWWGQIADTYGRRPGYSYLIYL